MILSKPVIFRKGVLSDFGMPIEQFLGVDDQSLYFVEDENSLYKSVGAGLPLVKFSDVLSGFIDGDDLVNQIPVGIENKIYLTNNGKIYYYSDDKWNSIVAEAQIDSFESEKVTFTRTDTTLSSKNVSDAIKELDDKVSEASILWEQFEFQ